MDRTQIAGIVLIFALAYLFMVYNTPSEAEIEAQKRIQDSIAALQQVPEPDIAVSDELNNNGSSQALDQDTSVQVIAQEESLYYLENDKIKVTFSNKGGQIVEAELKEHFQIHEDEDHVQTKTTLKMMNHPKNRMEYQIKGINNSTLRTGDLFFNASQQGNSITFKYTSGNIQLNKTYVLPEEGFTLSLNVTAPGISNHTSQDEIDFNWENYINKLELNEQYERYYSTVYYKETDEHPDYCSCRDDDQEKLDEKGVDWLSHANQFFNTSVVPVKAFTDARVETVMLEDDDESLKLLKSKASLAIESFEGSGLDMKIYVGPNDFEGLKAFNNDLEDIIPFGTSIFGTINRWIIRPIFNFLSTFIGSAGLVIIILTFIVKLALYPLTYKMLYSQSKMAVLKPEIEKVKAKFKDDQSKIQMETMKMYREFGVNPLGGCMPMVLQMPIWFALYRFFPASLEFRQASFLWANDLSSYDVIAYLPFDIPMFGSHISLFTILWVLTTLIYTWYNSQFVDMSANPAMKYMQYLMPVMFLFFFNNYASGLTAYLMFSNIFNISQTMITKNFVFDQDKIKAKLDENKKKPKKKGKFASRLESALKEQQKVQEQKQKGKK
jgi:YidC/Oxa1 family membrane protein insertase